MVSLDTAGQVTHSCRQRCLAAGPSHPSLRGLITPVLSKLTAQRGAGVGAGVTRRLRVLQLGWVLLWVLGCVALLQ